MTQSFVVPKPLWAAFVQTLSERATGRPVRVQVESLSLGDQELAEREPLLEIDFETKGSSEGALLISLGSNSVEETHVVKSPRTMAVGLNEGSFAEWLAIEEEDGTKTIITFEHQLKLNVGTPEGPQFVSL